MKKLFVVFSSVFAVMAFAFGICLFQQKNAVAETQIVPVVVENFKTGAVIEKQGYSYITNQTITESFETSYNMCDEILLVTENQNPLGLCWTFASNKAVETYIAKNFGEFYNFSESWVGITQKLVDNAFFLDDGGNQLGYADGVNTYGLVLEANMPYDQVVNYDESDYLNCYAYYQQFASTDLVKDVEFGAFRNYNNSQKELTMQNMKHYLKNYGSIYVSVASDRFQANSDGTTFVNSTLTTPAGSHALSIVGWDDNYVAGSSRGAWIALNSWGSSKEFVYVMYDDKYSSQYVSALVDITYSGITFAQVKAGTAENYLKLTDSNANFDFYGQTSQTQTLQDNIFRFNDELICDLTYSYPSGWGNIDVKILQDNVDITSSFDIAQNTTSKTLNITLKNEYAGALFGTCTIFINVEQGFVTLLKQFVVFTGAEVSYISYWQPRNDGYIHQIYNSGYNGYANQLQNIIVTTDTTFYLSVYFTQFASVVDYNWSAYGATVTKAQLGNLTGYFVPATQSTPASNSPCLSITPKQELAYLWLEFVTLDGYIYYYDILIYSIDDGDEIAYIEYDDFDNTLEFAQNQTIVLSNNEEFYLSNPSKENQEFVGWFFDEDCYYELPSDNKGYYLTLNDCKNYAVENSPYSANIHHNPDVFVKLYPKFKQYTINYDLNGANGNIASNIVYDRDKDYTIASDVGLSKNGFLFNGWKVVGTNNTLTAGQTYTLKQLEELFGKTGGEVTLSANWIALEYHIVFDLNGGFGNAEAYNQTINYVADANYIIPDLSIGITKQNYHIDYVYTQSGEKYELNQSVLLSDLAKDANNQQQIILTIFWAGNVYDLTYMANGEPCTLLPSTHTYGTQTTLPNAPSVEGYDFVGWCLYQDLSDTPIQILTASQITKNTTLYAKYQVQTFTVSIFWFDDKTTAKATKSFDYGTYFDITNNYGIDLPNDAYRTSTFDFWSNVFGERYLQNIQIKSDLDIYANFAIDFNVFTFNFFNYDGSLLGTEGFVFNNQVTFGGQTPQKPETIEFLYVFSGWSLTAENQEVIQDMILGGSVLDFASNSQAISLFAVFDQQIQKYSCRFFDIDQSGNPSEIVAFKFSLEYNQSLDLDIFTWSKETTLTHQYNFDGWFSQNGYLTGDWGQKIETFVATGDTEVFAKFTQTDVLYAVKFYYQASGSEYVLIDNLTQNVKYQTEINLSNFTSPQKPASHTHTYEFAGWALTTLTSATLNSIVVTENTSIYAVFTPILRQYSARLLIPDGSVNLLFDVITEDYGTTINLANYIPQKQSTYSKEFTFTGWFLNEDFTGNAQTTITILDNINYYAKFIPKSKTYQIKLAGFDPNNDFARFNYTFNQSAISLELFVPSKPKTAQHVYIFEGWFSKNGSSTGDWGQEVFEINFNDNNTSSQADIITTVYPKFSSQIRNYTINFYNGQIKLTNTDIYNQLKVPYGEVARYDRPLEKASTETQVFEFAGWAKENSTEIVTDLTVLHSDNLEDDDGIISFYAVFDASTRYYSLVLYKDFGSQEVYKTIPCVYQQVVNLSAENITKKSTKTEYFEFTGWRYFDTNEKCPSVLVVSGDTSLYASFVANDIPFKLSEKAKTIIWVAIGSLVALVAVVIVFKVLVSKGRQTISSKRAQKAINHYRVKQQEFEARRAEIEEIKQRTLDRKNKK